MRSTMRPVVLTATILAAAAPARGQYVASSTGFSWNNPMSATLDVMISDSIMTNAIMRHRAAGSQSGPPIRSATTTFRSGGRRALLDRVAPAQREQVAKLLAACDRFYEVSMRTGAGITSREVMLDLATSTAFYLEISRSVAMKDVPGAPADADAAQFRTLSSRVREGYANRGTFANRSDAEKQLAHDGLLLAACLPAFQYFEATRKHDPAGQQAARAAATAQLAKLHLTPASFHYGPNGTVKLD